MTVYVLRRLLQTAWSCSSRRCSCSAALFLVGDPVEMLVNPQADDDREGAGARSRWGWTSRCWAQYVVFLGRRADRRPGQVFVYRPPGAGSDPGAHAGDARARLPGDADRGRARHAARPLCRAASGQPDRADDHGRLDHRLLAADVLGRAGADHGVRGRNSAGCRRPDAARPSRCFGMDLSILHWEGLRYALLPALNLALFKLSLIIRLTRAQVREKHPARLHPVRARQGAVERAGDRRAPAEEHPDPAGHGDRPRAGLGDRVRDRHRDDLRLAGHGQARHRLDLPARPAGGGRLPAGHRASCSS